MKIKNAILKLARNGFEVKDYGRFIIAKRDGAANLIEMLRNGGDYTADVATIKVRKPHDQDDSRADFSAGFFCTTLAEAIRNA